MAIRPAELYGVDVHTRYQAGINFATLRREGYAFACTKASQGTHLTFPDFPRWVELTRDAALVPGAYHWIDNSDTGQAQARFFNKALAPVGGAEGLIIQLDDEDNATEQQTETFCLELEQLTGGHPFLIYTGSWWWRPRGWDGASLTPLLWDSRYLAADLDTVPDDPAAFAARIPEAWWRLPNKWPEPDAFGYGGWTSATFLQFTSRGDAGGLGNNVDLNATRLSMAQLLALTTSKRPAPSGGDMYSYQFDGSWTDRPAEIGDRIVNTDGIGAYDVEPFSTPRQGRPAAVVISKSSSTGTAKWSFAETFAALTGGCVFDPAVGSGLAEWRKVGAPAPAPGVTEDQVRAMIAGTKLAPPEADGE